MSGFVIEVLWKEKWLNYLQTVGTLIRHCILWHLILVCTVCQLEYNGLTLCMLGNKFSRQHFEICLSLNLRGGEHIDFGANPVGVGIGICIGVTLSCLYNIFWTSGWILTQFSWLYNWNITKNWSDLGDDLIFKVTAVEKLKIHSWGTSGFSDNTVTIFFLIFPRTKDLTFHADCLQRRQFACNVMPCFLVKIRKKYMYNQFVIRWIIPESGKVFSTKTMFPLMNTNKIYFYGEIWKLSMDAL